MIYYNNYHLQSMKTELVWEVVKMLHFMEGYLKKKQQVAERLYVYGQEFPRENATKNLGISHLTLSQYLAEVHQLYNDYYESGCLYNSNSLQKIAVELVSRSKKVEALRLLFLYPGKSASFYKDSLNTSDASFARLIAALKEDLERFQVTIVVKNGYRIQAKDELQFCFLFTYIGLFYYWSRDDLLAILIKHKRDEMLQKILAYDFSPFTYANDDFENVFFQTICLIYILRQCQQKVLSSETFEFKPIEMIFNQFERTMISVNEQLRNRLPEAIAACFPNSAPPVETKDALLRLATCVGFQVTLFPYNVNTLPLRMMFFNRKYRVEYPERLDSLNTFIYRMSDFLRIDFRMRYEMVFHYLVAEDLLDFQKRKNIHLYVYSSIGLRRTKYLYNQFEPLLGYFKETSTISIIQKEDFGKLPNNAYLVTTDLLSAFPKERQFMISDFISAEDYLMILAWLRRSEGITD